MALDVTSMRRAAAVIATTAGVAILGNVGSPVVLASADSTGRYFYVAPTGSPANPGTEARPLDLATALSTKSPAQPGDTIWVRGGLYEGTFTSDLVGTAEHPIIVRAYPGEQPRLDGGTARDISNPRVRGRYTWYWGLEIFSSSPDRGDDPQRARGPSDLSSGPNRFIHLIVHDTRMGMFLGSGANGSEVYGSLSYHVGFEGASRGHGHDIYSQNASSNLPRLIEENIGVSGFSHGLHAYASNSVHRTHAIGNIYAVKGHLSSERPAARNILIGAQNSDTAAIDPVVRENFTYYPAAEGENNIGFKGGATGAQIRGNYWIGGRRSLNVETIDVVSSAMTGNVLYQPTSPSTLPSIYPENAYHGSTRPKGIWTFVRPVGRYEPGRAHVVIYNWDLASSVTVSLASSGLQQGQAYEVRDAFNWPRGPVTTGVYEATKQTVTLSMTNLTMARPIGSVPVAPVHPAPEFGVFIVVPTGKQNPDEPRDPPAPPSGVRIVS